MQSLTGRHFRLSGPLEIGFAALFPVKALTQYVIQTVFFFKDFILTPFSITGGGGGSFDALENGFIILKVFSMFHFSFSLHFKMIWPFLDS